MSVRRLQIVSLAVVAAALAACAQRGAAPASAAASQPSAAQMASSPAVIEEVEEAKPTPAPGEAALADGLKAYQAGQYKQAETQLNAALKAGLKAPADLVAAHKHLAFIYCTSKRDTQCAAAFKAAKAADPNFALSKAEAGHPMWARTYKRALGLK